MFMKYASNYVLAACRNPWGLADELYQVSQLEMMKASEYEIQNITLILELHAVRERPI
jgi:hypothetical protein